jgi:alkylhydroperoxidase family enzyme
MISNPLAYLAPAISDMATLVVSQDSSCRYCFGMQQTIFRVLGYSEDQIARLQRDLDASGLSPTEKAALQLARRLSRADPRPARADLEALIRAGLPRPAVAELAFVTAATVFANRIATLLALPPAPFEAMVRRPVFRLLRPFIARQVRKSLRPPERLPVPNDGPCAELVAALDGSPTARVLRSAIDACWSSTVLPARTKLLIVVVIARALGCARSEAEARTMLAREGVAAATVDEVVATLSSPALDAREVRLVPFARETVRYRDVGLLQRRMRETVAGLSTEEILDAVGTMSLANAVCRLSVLLDLC